MAASSIDTVVSSSTGSYKTVTPGDFKCLFGNFVYPTNVNSVYRRTARYSGDGADGLNLNYAEVFAELVDITSAYTGVNYESGNTAMAPCELPSLVPTFGNGNNVEIYNPGHDKVMSYKEFDIAGTTLRYAIPTYWLPKMVIDVEMTIDSSSPLYNKSASSNPNSYYSSHNPYMHLRVGWDAKQLASLGQTVAVPTGVTEYSNWTWTWSQYGSTYYLKGATFKITVDQSYLQNGAPWQWSSSLGTFVPKYVAFIAGYRGRYYGAENNLYPLSTDGYEQNHVVLSLGNKWNYYDCCWYQTTVANDSTTTDKSYISATSVANSSISVPKDKLYLPSKRDYQTIHLLMRYWIGSHVISERPPDPEPPWSSYFGLTTILGIPGSEVVENMIDELSSNNTMILDDE